MKLPLLRRAAAFLLTVGCVAAWDAVGWAAPPTNASPSTSFAAVRTTAAALSVVGEAAYATLLGHPVAMREDAALRRIGAWLAAQDATRAVSVWAQRLPVLRPGAHGAPVAVLQEGLRRKGFAVAVDGVYGTVTERALLAWERRQGLASTTRVTRRVWRALLGVPVEAQGRSLDALAQTYGTTPVALAAWNAVGPARPDSWTRPLFGTVWLMPGELLPSNRVWAASADLGSAGSSSPSQAQTGAKPLSVGQGSAKQVTGTGPRRRSGTPPTSEPVASSASPGHRTGSLGAGQGMPPTQTHGGASLSQAARFFALVLATPRGSSAAAYESLAAWLGTQGISATVAVPPGTALRDPTAMRALSLMGADIALWITPSDTAARLSAAVTAVTRVAGTPPLFAYAGPFPTAAQAALAAQAHLALILPSAVEDQRVAGTPGSGSVWVVEAKPGAAPHTLGSWLRAVHRAGFAPGPALSLLTTGS